MESKCRAIVAHFLYLLENTSNSLSFLGFLIAVRSSGGFLEQNQSYLGPFGKYNPWIEVLKSFSFIFALSHPPFSFFPFDFERRVSYPESVKLHW